MTGHHLADLVLWADGGKGRDIIEHLLIDRAMKMGIVVLALLVFALGMVIIMKNVNGRR